MVAISDVAIALIGGRGGAVATQNVLKPHVEQLNAQTPCARGNARGPWVAQRAWVRVGSGHGCGHRGACSFRARGCQNNGCVLALLVLLLVAINKNSYAEMLYLVMINVEGTWIGATCKSRVARTGARRTPRVDGLR